jgi:hypothetical protein
MIDLEGPLSYTSSALSLKGEVHLNVGALLDINLIWFGKIGEFSRSNYFYLPSVRLWRGGGGQHPVTQPSVVSYVTQGRHGLVL